MTDEGTYCDEMSKGIEEKLFFSDHISPDVLVDFGCADGQVTEAINEVIGCRAIALGYDTNLDLLPEVEIDVSKAINYFHEWDELINFIGYCFPRQNCEVAIYLSSILHEIYSNGDFDEVFEKVFLLDPDYIIIRDMYMTDFDKRQYLEEPQIKKTLDNVNLRYVNSFVNERMPIENKEGFIHFLMKHRFAYNWDYEVQEDYFALTDEAIRFWESFGKVVFKEHEPLPYYVDVFEERYKYELTTQTHIKLIIER